VDAERNPREIETEIDHLRTRLDKSLAELDRRRHELTDVKLQLRRHPRVVLGAGAAVALLAAGVTFALWRAHQREKPLAKAHRFRLALSRAVARPEQVAKAEPGVGEKILASVGTTIAVALAKKAIDYAWRAMPQAERERLPN
jgi:hypothetical protein